MLLICKIWLIEAKYYQLNKQDPTNNKYFSNDSSYAYVDTYVSTCMDKLMSCSSGGLAINITVYESDEPLVVLISSGGDSPYSPSGLYLHQYNVNGYKYMEFGITVYDLVYSVKVGYIHFFLFYFKIN